MGMNNTQFSANKSQGAVLGTLYQTMFVTPIVIAIFFI